MNENYVGNEKYMPYPILIYTLHKYTLYTLYIIRIYKQYTLRNTCISGLSKKWVKNIKALKSW